MTLYVKNMVCPRCISVVGQTLARLGLRGHIDRLGEVTLDEAPSPALLRQLEEALRSDGFELLSEDADKLATQIQSLIIDLVYQHGARLETTLSDYLTARLHRNYSSLSTLFRQTHGQTIERYFIAVRLERVKELIFYNELSLKEIAFMLNYSSVAHLSTQFKRETGLTPSAYRQQGRHHEGLDNL